MREEITEPQHWRANSQRSAKRNASWSSRRPRDFVAQAADAIDAALAEEEKPPTTPESRPIHRSDFVSSDIISNLASQLDLLEKQREQLLKMLAQAETQSES